MYDRHSPDWLYLTALLSSCKIFVEEIFSGANNGFSQKNRLLERVKGDEIRRRKFQRY
jgi:hypothetical protein